MPCCRGKAAKWCLTGPLDRRADRSLAHARRRNAKPGIPAARPLAHLAGIPAGTLPLCVAGCFAATPGSGPDRRRGRLAAVGLQPVSTPTLAVVLPRSARRNTRTVRYPDTASGCASGGHRQAAFSGEHSRWALPEGNGAGSIEKNAGSAVIGPYTQAGSGYGRRHAVLRGSGQPRRVSDIVPVAPGCQGIRGRCTAAIGFDAFHGISQPPGGGFGVVHLA